MIKKNLSKMSFLFVIALLLFTFISCGKKDGENDNTKTSNPTETSVTNPTEENEDQDFVVTFHYSFDETATFDENGKASEYSKELEKTSTSGKKVNLTAANVKLFEVEGYKIVGYSTEDWKKNGIKANMDVFVYYAKLTDCIVTFQNPNGTTIKTLNVLENYELEETDFPTEEQVLLSEGKFFIGWKNIPADNLITESVTIIAQEGSIARYEAEKAQKIYFDGYPEDNNVTISSTGSGGASVYLYDNNKDAAGRTQVAPVGMEFTFEVEEDTKVILGTAIWVRKGATEAKISSIINILAKAENDSDFTIVPSDATFSCTTSWGDFQNVTYGTILMKKGLFTIKIIGGAGTLANIDYIELKGDVDKVSYPKHTLTLTDGALFKNGETSMKVVEGGILPEGITVPTIENKYHCGWTDGKNNYSLLNFVMSNKDTTLTPLYNDGNKVSLNLVDSQKVGSDCTLTATNIKFYKDDSYNTENTWIEMTIDSTGKMNPIFALNTVRRSSGKKADGTEYTMFDLYDFYIKKATDTEYEKIVIDSEGTYYTDVVIETLPYISADYSSNFASKRICTLKLEEGQYNIKLQGKADKWEKATSIKSFDFEKVLGDIVVSRIPISTFELNANSTDITIDGIKDSSYVLVGNLLKKNKLAGKTLNEALDANVYMTYKANTAYIFIEVKDPTVLSVGKETRSVDYPTSYRNDQIEFWFIYGTETTKVCIDAFGYGLLSLNDGIAKAIADTSNIKYATTLVGANLTEFNDGSAKVATNATGYNVEFSLPLDSKQDSLKDTLLKWTLQVDSVDDLSDTASSFSANGVQLKTNDDLKAIDKIYTIKFVD